MAGKWRILAVGLMLGWSFTGPVSAADSPPSHRAAPAAIPVPPYADLADLADEAPLVMKVRITSVSEVEPARAGNVRPGWARLYIEALTESLLTGPAAVGEAQRYLADVPRDAKGKVPRLKKQAALIFARHVPDQPGQLQLIAPDAQIAWSQAVEDKVTSILSEINAPDAPHRITGVKEAMFVPGNLAGEGETQMFLTTADGEPAAITVRHHPGLPVTWGISWSELVESAGTAPPRDTLVWYRLACFLPSELPEATNLSGSEGEKAQARADYAKVIADLGPCRRDRLP